MNRYPVAFGIPATVPRSSHSGFVALFSLFVLFWQFFCTFWVTFCLFVAPWGPKGTPKGTPKASKRLSRLGLGTKMAQGDKKTSKTDLEDPPPGTKLGPKIEQNLKKCGARVCQRGFRKGLQKKSGFRWSRVPSYVQKTHKKTMLL